MFRFKACLLLSVTAISYAQAKTDLVVQNKPPVAQKEPAKPIITKSKVAPQTKAPAPQVLKPQVTSLKPIVVPVAVPVKPANPVATPAPVVPKAQVQNSVEPEPIYLINQRFAQVPLMYCPMLSKGYGFEVRYADKQAPTITKVYGNAYLAGLKEGVTLLAVNGQTVNTQAQFNTIVYQGRARESTNLIEKMTLSVQDSNGTTVASPISLAKGDYCLSNISVETERNILRMDFSTKGSGYSAKADARVYTDADFLKSLNQNDWLTIAAVSAGEQYRNGLRVKRGKTGLFIGQVFGTIVTMFTGVPITDLTASSANAIGMKDHNEGALRPAISYGYYLGLAPAHMKSSLAKLVSYREGYKVQGKRYDWPIPDDLSEFDAIVAELNARVQANEKDLMLQPKQPKAANAKAATDTISPPAAESQGGVATY